MLRKVVTGITLGVAALTVLCASDGCLTRPVVAGNPKTNTNFITSISQGTIDKVDLLFDIDNSASMGDKQEYLSEAVPDLIGRLVAPNCVLADGTITGTADINGVCANSQANAEFPPVHNMHIGIISSSLGARLGDACPAADPSNLAACTSPNQTGCSPVDSTLTLAGGKIIDRHNDDQAHLLNRSSPNVTTYTDTPLGDATDGAGDNFLDWFPSSTSNTNVTPTGPAPVTVASTLNSDFSQMVIGVHQFGCGIESQLESWYRFLIQPDPYASLSTATITRSGQKQTIAQWVGVDTTILAQRADFLRPDSLVAILVLTDENDSEVDVRSIGGTGYNFMSQNGFNPPRGTSACQSGVAANVAGSSCTSCAFGGNTGDSSCQTNVGPNGYGIYTSAFDWGWDLNLRHVHEKQKYGVDVQFPIKRYVLGLTSTLVPARNDEYPPDTNGDGGYATSYQGLTNLNCTNPLFAASLPTAPGGNVSSWNPTAAELCKLPLGTRSPNLVFYAHIGGVPHQLLQVNPSGTSVADQSQKSTLLASDWQLILGKDPQNYDYTGIDPHMVESFQPRTGVPVPTGGFPVADPSKPEGTDPISGREWVTNSSPTGTAGSTTFPQGAQHNGLNVDREFACTFKLPTGARDCSDKAVAADPTLADSCDCQTPVMGTGTSFSHEDLPAVCNDTTQTNQDSAKAYPTIRELLLANLLGAQGIISSLCPIDITDNAAGNDPLYGYRPAMNAIIAKLSAALSSQCLPQRLDVSNTVVDGGSTVPEVNCLVLGTFPSTSTDGGQSIANCASANNQGTPSDQGWVNPDPTVLSEFRTDQHATWAAAPNNGAGIDPSTELTCELSQLPAEVHCDTGSSVGWCYVDDGTVKGCPQAILFNKQALTQGVVTSLQCLEESPSILNEAGTFTTSPAAASDAGTGGD